jgi:hypothetical protein
MKRALSPYPGGTLSDVSHGSLPTSRSLPKTLDYLNFAAETYVNSSGAQPFFLMTGFRDPHAPWAAPQRMYDLYNTSSIATATNKVRETTGRGICGRRQNGFRPPRGWGGGRGIVDGFDLDI